MAQPAVPMTLDEKMDQLFHQGQEFQAAYNKQIVDTNTQFFGIKTLLAEQQAEINALKSQAASPAVIMAAPMPQAPQARQPQPAPMQPMQQPAWAQQQWPQQPMQQPAWVQQQPAPATVIREVPRRDWRDCDWREVDNTKSKILGVELNSVGELIVAGLAAKAAWEISKKLLG